MKRRQLPSHLRRRVRHFERQRWAAMGGQDEMELIRDLPDGLRRDIKRYLCIDLIKKVTRTFINIYLHNGKLRLTLNCQIKFLQR
jgi:hypothetical protein